MTLELLVGGGNPKSYRAKSKQDTESIYCPECASSLFIEIVGSPKRRGMRWLKRSGTRTLICYNCFLIDRKCVACARE